MPLGIYFSRHIWFLRPNRFVNIFVDSIFVLAVGYLRTPELKLSVFSWFQVVLTKDVFPYLSATLSVTCNIDFILFCRPMLSCEMQLLLWEGERAVLQGLHLMPLLVFRFSSSSLLEHIWLLLFNRYYSSPCFTLRMTPNLLWLPDEWANENRCVRWWGVFVH